MVRYKILVQRWILFTLRSVRNKVTVQTVPNFSIYLESKEFSTVLYLKFAPSRTVLLTLKVPSYWPHSSQQLAVSCWVLVNLNNKQKTARCWKEQKTVVLCTISANSFPLLPATRFPLPVAQTDQRPIAKRSNGGRNVSSVKPPSLVPANKGH